MWGSRKLSSSGSRFLKVLRFGYLGTQSGCPRFTTSAGECIYVCVWAAWRGVLVLSPPCGPAVLRTRGRGRPAVAGLRVRSGKDPYLRSGAHCLLNRLWLSACPPNNHRPTPAPPLPPPRLGKIPEDLRSRPRRSQPSDPCCRSSDLCLVLVEFLPLESATTLCLPESQGRVLSSFAAARRDTSFCLSY